MLCLGDMRSIAPILLLSSAIGDLTRHRPAAHPPLTRLLKEPLKVSLKVFGTGMSVHTPSKIRKTLRCFNRWTHLFMGRRISFREHSQCATNCAR